MRTLTLYFTPKSNERLVQIRSHLGGSLSHVVAQILAVAEGEAATNHSRPWETDVPSTQPASRHTIYLHTRSAQRLEDLRQTFQSREPGVAILQSVVVARAIALAEPRLLALTPDQIELQRVASDAAAFDIEVSHLEEDWGEEIILKLVACMHQAAALFTRVQKVQARTHTRSTKLEAADLIVGPLNDLMARITAAIRRVRRETDARHSVG